MCLISRNKFQYVANAKLLCLVEILNDEKSM